MVTIALQKGNNVVNIQVYSTIWEGQFIEIIGKFLPKNIILGNIYKPPSENIGNYKEVIIAGDFNINLLRVSTMSIFGDFLDAFITHSFYPKITLITRFSKYNATLI